MSYECCSPSFNGSKFIWFHLRCFPRTWNRSFELSGRTANHYSKQYKFNCLFNLNLARTTGADVDVCVCVCVSCRSLPHRRACIMNLWVNINRANWIRKFFISMQNVYMYRLSYEMCTACAAPFWQTCISSNMFRRKHPCGGWLLLLLLGVWSAPQLVRTADEHYVRTFHVSAAAKSIRNSAHAWIV